MTEIPTLTTDRLILRGPRPSDWEEFAAYRASPRMASVGGPFDRIQAFGQFLQLHGHWPVRGYGRFVVEERDTGAFIGIVGPFYPEGWPEPELAWGMSDAGEGKGYAYEAALACRRFAYDSLGFTRLISAIDPSNARSVALAKRMGCTETDPFEHPTFGTLHLWLHPSPEALT